MAGGVGNLTVGLGLDAAQFTQGLTKAQAQAAVFAGTLKGTFAGNILSDLTNQLATIPDRFVGLIRSAIDAANHLGDLSKKTGIAADTIGGIGFAAKQAGSDLDSASAGVDKLNKSIVEAVGGNKQAAQAFSLVGLSLKDLKNADPTDVLKKISAAFANSEDGPEKTAIAVKLFGKAGADLIPLLDSGSDAIQRNIDFYKRYSGVTVDVTEKAEQFNSTLAKLNLINQSFGQQLAAALLPSLQTLADKLLAAKENSDLFERAARGISDIFNLLIAGAANVAFVFDQVGQGIGALAAAGVAALRGDFAGIPEIFKSYNDQAAAARKGVDSFTNAILGADRASKNTDFLRGEKGGYQTGDFAPNTKKRRLGNLTSDRAAVDDPTKQLLDAQLKALDGQITLENDLLATRNRFLDFYNNQSLLSVQDYYAGRTAAQAEALKKETDLLNQEIALLQKDQNRPGQTQKGRAEDEVKLQELIGKRTKLEQQAGEQSVYLTAQQQKAYEDLANSILSVSAQVLDLKENFAQAAAIKFDLQNDALKKTFTANGNEAGLEAIATLRAATIAQAAFQKASLDASRTLDALSDAEARVTLAQQTGALGSLEALVKLGDARRAQIPLLEAQVEAEEAIAKAAKDAGTAGFQTLELNAAKARLQLDQLKATVDPLADSLNKAFGQDFNSALDDFVTGTKSATDAFHSFTKAVLNDILKMGSKSITESLFGGGSGGGGIGGLLSQLFSSSNKSSSADLSAPGAASDAGNGLSSTNVGFLSSAAKLFAGFFADGGYIPPGKYGVVGEQGPEVAFGGATGKTIQPMSSGNTQHINVSVQGQPGMSHDTLQQQGAAIGLGIQRALARNT